MFKRGSFRDEIVLRARVRAQNDLRDLAELFSFAQILRLGRNARFLYHLLLEFLSFSFRRSVYERRLRSSAGFTVVLFPSLALHDATTPFSCFCHSVNWRPSHSQRALYVARWISHGFIEEYSGVDFDWEMTAVNRHVRLLCDGVFTNDEGDSQFRKSNGSFTSSLVGISYSGDFPRIFFDITVL